MRCPICNARVKNEDALQIHYIESCEGVGKEESPDPRSDGNGFACFLGPFRRLFRITI